jgi:tetratricopeptide (TPR) repeat protein
LSTTDRLESLLSLAEQDPENTFLRYGLAMEFARLDRTEEALQSFRQLIEKNPLYVAAYYQMGTLLVRRGEIEEARRIYSEGIEAAVQKADWHAKSELEAALEGL